MRTPVFALPPQTDSFANRLRVFAQLMRERAELMPPGPKKADKLAKADQADARAKLDGWLSAPELKPPT